jgi:hypothetical protein
MPSLSLISFAFSSIIHERVGSPTILDQEFPTAVERRDHHSMFQDQTYRHMWLNAVASHLVLLASGW